MKTSVCVLLGFLVSSASAGECDFDIAGTWEAVAARGDTPLAARYRFGGDGTVFTLSRTQGTEDWVERAGSSAQLYRLDDPKAPSIIEFLGKDGASRRGSMEISQFDDSSFTTLDANSEATRWVRVDPERYFIVFTSSQGDVAHGGPAFAMLIRAGADGRGATDSFGFYLASGEPVVGPIPAILRSKLLMESRLDSDTMFRIEVTRSEFERAEAVLQSWDRRARERTLLYEVPYLNNIVFLEQLSGTLNRCHDRIRAQKLQWNVGDPITAAHNLPQVSFFYIRELRRQNDSQHLSNEQFRARMGTSCVGDCRAPRVAVKSSPLAGVAQW